MKKIFALALSLMMIASFAACGNDDATTEDETAPETAAEETVDETPAEVPAEELIDEAPVEETDVDGDPAEEATGEDAVVEDLGNEDGTDTEVAVEE